MSTELKNETKFLDDEFREILIAILRAGDDAGAEECVERLNSIRNTS